MKLSTDTINLIMISKTVSERNGFGYVPEIIAFGTLAVMEDSPLHRYLINQGMEHLEIVDRVTELYNKHFPEEEERFFKYEEIIESTRKGAMATESESLQRFTEATIENNDPYLFATVEFVYESGGRSGTHIVITTDLLEIIQMASTIAQDMYNDSYITNSYMLAAFTEYMHPIFFISMELGIPCLIGNNSDIFEKDEELKKYIVTSTEDNAIINSKMIIEILNNKEKIKELYKEWKIKYNKEAQESIERFIEK